MINERIELCDGNVAFYDEDDGLYVCRLAWLGREIRVRLYSDEGSAEAEVEAIKKAFEKFYINKKDFLSTCQNDIVEKLLPYMAETYSPTAFLSVPPISEDDFYADYSLSEVYIGTLDGDKDIQLTFSAENDDILCVRRDLDNGNILEFFDGLKSIYPDEMDL